jgi:hypothetical protein
MHSVLVYKLAGCNRTGYKTGDRRRTTLTADPPLVHSKVVATVNLAHRGKKRFLDLEFDCVVNRRASGLVRFSYKLSIFQIVGFVICGLEAAGV